MASFYLQGSSASASESADGADWMADMQGEGRDVSKAAPIAPAAAVVLGPVVKPAPVSWMTPKICSAETGSDSTPLKRQTSADTFPEKKQRKRADWDKNAALSAAAAQKSAAASEAAVRLASLAVKQMLQTKEATTAAAKGLATPKGKKTKAAMAATSSTAAGQSADSPQSTEKGVNPEHEVRPEEIELPLRPGEEADDAEEIPEADVAEPAEDAGSRREVGTFAGNRPPKDPDALELFNYKKDMYHAARGELEKKYPGKVVTLGRTSSQLGWWAHLRDHMLLAKGPDHKKKRNSMSKEEAKEAIAAAAKTWKAKVSKLAVARGRKKK